jgi:parvulin-like peptidyl-prolyl isomerase
MPANRALFLVLALVLGSSLGCSKKDSFEPEAAPAESGDAGYGLSEAQASEVLAKIGDRTITVGEFAEIIGSKSPYIRARFEAPEQRKELLDNLIRFELLVYEAKRQGYDQRPEIVRARRSAMVQQLLKEEVDDKLQLTSITDAEIQAAYEADPDQFNRPAQVRARAIVVSDRAKAQEALSKALETSSDDDFRALVEEYSEDEASRQNDGDLRFFSLEQSATPPKAVRQAAFKLSEIGSVYPELVKTDDGFYILRLIGKRAALQRTYEQSKRAVRHKLFRERKEAARQALLDELRAEFVVEIDYAALADVKVDVPNLPKGR